MPADPAAALVAAHRAQGLGIDAWTTGPGWHGERLDLGWAISVLHPANPGAYQPADPAARRLLNLTIPRDRAWRVDCEIVCPRAFSRTPGFSYGPMR